jgi:hypothetical protein
MKGRGHYELVHQPMVAPRRVVQVRYVMDRGVRWAYAYDLECGHLLRFRRRSRSATAKIRDCLDCAGKPLAERPPARPGGARAAPTRSSSAEVAVLRAALERLLADPAARGQAYDAIGSVAGTEADERARVLEELAGTVVRSLQIHPYGPEAMELRQNQERLCRIAGLVPSKFVVPETPARSGASPPHRGRTDHGDADGSHAR